MPLLLNWKCVTLLFNLHRQFHLDLWPSNSVFAHDHKSRQPDGTESHVDTSFIYDGAIRGKTLTTDVHKLVLVVETF